MAVTSDIKLGLPPPMTASISDSSRHVRDTLAEALHAERVMVQKDLLAHHKSILKQLEQSFQNMSDGGLRQVSSGSPLSSDSTQVESMTFDRCIPAEHQPLKTSLIGHASQELDEVCISSPEKQERSSLQSYEANFSELSGSSLKCGGTMELVNRPSNWERKVEMVRVATAESSAEQHPIHQNGSMEVHTGKDGKGHKTAAGNRWSGIGSAYVNAGRLSTTGHEQGQGQSQDLSEMLSASHISKGAASMRSKLSAEQFIENYFGGLSDENEGDPENNDSEPAFGGKPSLSLWGKLIRNILSPGSEATFCVLILFNVLCIGLEMQYVGIGNGFKLKFPGFHKDAEDTWPHFSTISWYLENIFGVIFTLECILKFMALNCKFFTSRWNCFDFFLVVTWIISFAINMSSILNPLLLRLLRLGKLMRLLRLVKTVKMLDSLHVLVTSTIASLSVLIWSSVLLVLLMTAVALVLGTLLRGYIEEESRPMDERLKLYKYFGSFTRSFLAVFEITLGNWVPICRMLLEDINEWYAYMIITYKLIVDFSVIKVITAVFMHETFKVAQTDDHLMVVQKTRANKSNAAKMMKLFDQADTEGDGGLTFDQFIKVTSDPFVKTWLSAMELSVHDLPGLFQLMDDGDGRLTPAELIAGVDRLKGGARGVDMVTVLFDLKVVKDALLDNLALQTLAGESVTATPAKRTSADFTVCHESLNNKLKPAPVGFR